MIKIPFSIPYCAAVVAGSTLGVLPESRRMFEVVTLRPERVGIRLGFGWKEGKLMLYAGDLQLFLDRGRVKLYRNHAPVKALRWYERRMLLEAARAWMRSNYFLLNSDYKCQ